MVRLSWRTLRERWALFVGSFLTVGLGVALVRSSLQVLIAAATASPPADAPVAVRERIAAGYSDAVPLLALTLAFAVFLTVFVVGSTFAATVAQRRRDLALLRLVGARRGQVHRLLLAEAVLLGVLGAAAGTALGGLATQVQTWLLVNRGFVPAGFTAAWRGWLVAPAAGLGIGVAVVGAFAAARRGSRVAPLEALRDTGESARVMTRGRWTGGLVFGGVAGALLVLTQVVPVVAAVPIAVNLSLTGSVAVVALAPLLVPAAAGLLGRVAGVVARGPLGGLAEAALRDGVRRSAATAAPVVVLTALLLGQAGTAASVSAAAIDQLRADTVGDLVVDGDLATGPGTPGVDVTSTLRTVPVTVVTTTVDDGETERETDSASAQVVDPATWSRVHRVRPRAGALADLRPGTVAATGGAVGDTLTVRMAGAETELRVVAVLPSSLAGPDLLLPVGGVPAALLDGVPAETILLLQPGADAAAVSADLRAAGHRQVRSLASWIDEQAAAQQDTDARVMTVLMGLATLFAVIGVVNAVVIAAADRRTEFATVRVAGLTRSQVVRTAVIESWGVTSLGLLFGGLVAGVTLAAAAGATGALAVPWTLAATLALGAPAVVGVTTVVTTLSATRRSPVHGLAVRE